ncbi:MAG: class I SAM-dependent methyltransferase [Acidobacteriota bacterium]
MTSRAIEFYNASEPARRGREDQPAELAETSRWLLSAPPGVVLELGCGHGALSALSPRYLGIDLGFVGLYKKRFRCAGADMERLPFRDESIAFIFSWAAIEHVPRPELVLAEIERVLAPEGVALLAPAWHCRPWAAEGLEFRPYRELGLFQRFRKALIPFRNSLVWRAPFAIFPRLSREFRASRGQRLSFSYARLEPNLDEYIGTDCDAFTSMDPHAAIMYFSSRGWRIPSHPSRRARLLARSEPVVVLKPPRAGRGSSST